MAGHIVVRIAGQAPGPPALRGYIVAADDPEMAIQIVRDMLTIAPDEQVAIVGRVPASVLDALQLKPGELVACQP